MAAAGAVIRRLQAPALQARVRQWQRQRERAALGRRPLRLGGVLSSSTLHSCDQGVGCSRASYCQAGRCSLAAAAALAAIGLGVKGAL